MTTSFAFRYFKSKKSTHAINLIAWISMTAIALVTAALIVVLSVFNGFENLVLSLYGDFYADIKITSVSGKYLDKTSSLLQKIQTTNGVNKGEAVIEERTLLVDEDDKSIVWLKGVSPQYAEVSGVPAHMIRGNFEIGTREKPAIVLGSGVENTLQVISGQTFLPVTIYLPNRNATNFSDPMEALHSVNAIPTGSFSIQQEFDNQYAYTNIGLLTYLFDLSPEISSAIEVYLTPGTNPKKVKSQLQKILGDQFVIKTRFEQNQGLFAAMQTEKLIIYAVAFLILIIAAFNIISSLTMTVLEKQEDIAVLMALGTTGKRVSLIFLKLGILLAGVGGGIGFILGILICLGQQHFHWIKLGGSSFIINHYPVAMRASDFLWVGIIIFMVAFFSGWLPSRNAASTNYSLKS